MAEVKKPEQPAATPEKPTLARAAESGDPDVHRLLADRQAHVQNIQPEDPEVAHRREVAAKAVEDIDKELAALGFTAN